MGGITVMSEKTEHATPHKLKKAKEKGQVNKSNELSTCISLLVVVLLMSLLWTPYLSQLAILCQKTLSLAGQMSFTPANIVKLHQWIMKTLLLLWLPVALTMLLGISLCTIAQTGFVWSTNRLTPDVKRLSFKQGVKKLCSMHSIFETLKFFLKLSTAALLFYWLFKNKMHIFIVPQLSTIPPVDFIAKPLFNFCIQLLLLLTVLAVLDKRYTQWKFKKEQKMTKQEVKEEYRQREGDPKIKSKIKQLQYQLRQKTAALKQVKHADVIITNPTHIAIALQYKRNDMPAPKVIYKAQDKMVQQVKDIAKQYDILVLEHKTLARLLHHSTALNHYITEDLYPLVAPIFKELYQRSASV